MAKTTKQAEREDVGDPDSSDERRSRFRRALQFARRRPKFFAGLCLLALFYLAALFADFLAPYDYRSQSRRELLAPSTSIHFQDAVGGWHARPFIYSRRMI